MTDETKRFIGRVVKAIAVATALGIPVALAMRHYIPDDTQVRGVAVKPVAMAVVLTGMEFAAYHLLFSEDSPAQVDVATQRALAEGV